MDSFLKKLIHQDRVAQSLFLLKTITSDFKYDTLDLLNCKSIAVACVVIRTLSSHTEIYGFDPTWNPRLSPTRIVEKSFQKLINRGQHIPKIKVLKIQSSNIVLSSDYRVC